MNLKLLDILTAVFCFKAGCRKTTERRLQQSRCIFVCKCVMEIVPTNGLSGVSPPRKFNSSASQISRIMWNPKAHYRIRKSTQLVYVLNRTDTIYTLRAFFFRFILMLSSLPCVGLPSGLYTFIFPPQHYAFLVSHVVSKETIQGQACSAARLASYTVITGVLSRG
jgi:hypothetical protein